MHEEEFEEIFRYLETCGAIKDVEYSADGEPTYRFDLEILKVAMPEMYEIIVKEIDQELMELYKLGLVDIEYDEDLNALFKISEKGRKYVETGIMPKYDVE